MNAKQLHIVNAAMVILAFLIAAPAVAQELENHEWRLVELEGRVVPPSAGEQRPFIRFDPVKKQTVGYAGCNSFFTGYTREGESLSFGLIGSTRRACNDLQEETERAFLKALGETRSWRIRDGVLLLKADRVLARFKRADDTR